MVRPIQVMIAGAAKSGTTSLLNYLGQHPDIYIHKQPEFNFFNDFEYHRGYQEAFSKYFSHTLNDKKIIVAKYARLMYIDEIVKRLYQHNPEIKLLVILRNPIERAYSDYWYNVLRGQEVSKTFEEAIKKEKPFSSKKWRKGLYSTVDNPYLQLGIYYQYIKKIFDVFGREKIQIIFLEELKQNSISVLNNICNNLNISTDIKLNLSQKYNQSARPISKQLAYFTRKIINPENQLKNTIRNILPDSLVYKLSYLIRNKLSSINRKPFQAPSMNIETRNYLIKYFYPHNQKLSELLNLDLSFWNR